MNPLGNIYAEGDPELEDRHLQPLDPIIVEGEGYLYGVRSVQIVALKESVRGNDFVSVSSGPNHAVGVTAAGQVQVSLLLSTPHPHEATCMLHTVTRMLTSRTAGFLVGS